MSERVVKCPVCGNNALQETDFFEYILCEEYINCGYCGYLYEYSYGIYTERIGRKEFRWNYTNNTLTKDKRIEKALFAARHNLRKGHKKQFKQNDDINQKVEDIIKMNRWWVT